MTMIEIDQYFASKMTDEKFKDAIMGLLHFYDQDAWRKCKSGKNSEDLLHAQGAGNMIDTLKNYFMGVVNTVQMIKDNGDNPI